MSLSLCNLQRINRQHLIRSPAGEAVPGLNVLQSSFKAPKSSSFTGMRVSGRAQEPVPSVEKRSRVACLAELLFYSKSWLSTNFVCLDWMEYGIRHFKTNTKCGKQAGIYSWTLAVSAVSALCPSIKLTARLGPLKLITFPSIIVRLTLDILRLSLRILLRKDWEFPFTVALPCYSYCQVSLFFVIFVSEYAYLKARSLLMMHSQILVFASARALEIETYCTPHRKQHLLLAWGLSDWCKGARKELAVVREQI